MAEQSLGLPQVNGGLRSGEFQFNGFFCPGAWTWPWQRQKGQLPRFFLLGRGTVITEIWRPPVLRARPPPCPPRWLVNPTLPSAGQPSWHPGLQAIFPSFVYVKPLEGPLGWEPGLLRAFRWPDLITA